MTATEDLEVAIRTLTDLTDTRARGPIAELRDAAELKAALRRTVPELLAILQAGLIGWDDLAVHAVALARAVNAQPDPHDEQPC